MLIFFVFCYNIGMNIEKKWDQKEEQLDLDFGSEKQKKRNQNEDQGHLDFRTEEEKERALIDRVLEERLNGTFSIDSLSKEDKERYLNLLEKERKENKEDDQPRYGH